MIHSRKTVGGKYNLRCRYAKFFMTLTSCALPDVPVMTRIMSGNPDLTNVPEDLFEVSPSLASSMTWL